MKTFSNLVRLVLIIIMVALMLGGTPWQFPGGGSYWIENSYLMATYTR